MSQQLPSQDPEVSPSKIFEATTVLAFSIVAGFLASVALWSLYPPTLDQTQKEVALLLYGNLGTALGIVIQYFFNRK
jgi:hypothetical protein